MVILLYKDRGNLSLWLVLLSRQFVSSVLLSFLIIGNSSVPVCNIFTDGFTCLKD